VQGWNLIGDPFLVPINFEALYVQGTGGSSPGPTQVGTAETNGLLGAALWSFSSGLYQPSYYLDPWFGYWLYAYQPLTLLVDPTATASNLSPKARAAACPLAAGNSEGGGWNFEIKAAADGAQSPPMTIGQNNLATDGYDRFKLVTPPAVTRKNVTMSVEHPDWGSKSGAYSVDIRSMSSPDESWPLTVSSNITDNPVVLTWPGVATVPRKVDVFLTDLDGKKTVNLRNRGSYTVSPGTNGVTHHFRVDVTRASREPLNIAYAVATVNGSGAGRAIPSVGVSYSLTAPATVAIYIKTLSGKVLRTLDVGDNQAAAPAEKTWDLKTDNNQTVGTGAFVIELRAVDQNGYTVRRSIPLVLAR
jgi:hypothetical protein